MAHSYAKQTWANFPDESTPITAEELNRMEDGIKDSVDSVNWLEQFTGFSLTQALNLNTEYSKPNLATGEVSTSVGLNLNREIKEGTKAISEAILRIYEDAKNIKNIYMYETSLSDATNQVITIDSTKLVPSDIKNFAETDVQYLLLSVENDIKNSSGINIVYTKSNNQNYMRYIYDKDGQRLTDLKKGLYILYLKQGDFYVFYNNSINNQQSSQYSKLMLMNEHNDFIIPTSPRGLSDSVMYSLNLDDTVLAKLKPSSPIHTYYPYADVLGGENNEYESTIFFKIVEAYTNDQRIIPIQLNYPRKYSNGKSIYGTNSVFSTNYPYITTYSNDNHSPTIIDLSFSIDLYSNKLSVRVDKYSVYYIGMSDYNSASIERDIYLECIWLTSNNPAIQELYNA